MRVSETRRDRSFLASPSVPFPLPPVPAAAPISTQSFPSPLPATVSQPGRSPSVQRVSPWNMAAKLSRMKTYQHGCTIFKRLPFLRRQRCIVDIKCRFWFTTVARVSPLTSTEVSVQRVRRLGTLKSVKTHLPDISEEILIGPGAFFPAVLVADELAGFAGLLGRVVMVSIVSLFRLVMSSHGFLGWL